jgi:hypothetical protein
VEVAAAVDFEAEVNHIALPIIIYQLNFTQFYLQRETVDIA